MSAVSEDPRLSDRPPLQPKDAPVGGQAVLEGVMMRGVGHWAVAIREPVPEDLDAEGAVDPQKGSHGGIHLEVFELESWVKRRRAYRLPVIRGFVALAESLKIGFKALNIASSKTMGEEEEEELKPWMWALMVMAAVALAAGLFFIAPVGLVSLIKDDLNSAFLFWLIEGTLEIVIFVAYLWAISRLRDLRRVFEYHGAEHKTIACYEAGDELTPERAARYSRLHPRCGTSFLLIVMVVAIFVFSAVGTLPWHWLIVTRICAIPLIVGISFEIIKFAGRNRSRRWVRAIMWPGMQLQLLTTREPDHDQLEVAIAALGAVLDREDPRAATGEDLVGMEVHA